ncbi:hypothetical protein RchiOBHm_Chr5g0034241 [Rosa chinensis]|uniref:Uncharacterized protein n=1 Tax=Rosa chinensis TaxID=74649 RepID=A0A2P6QAX7_ROSCH|nr:hypothetical protein RchiOBHm_Chr5g0034241 [Rosa chinensis]
MAACRSGVGELAEGWWFAADLGWAFHQFSTRDLALGFLCRWWVYAWKRRRRSQAG